MIYGWRLLSTLCLVHHASAGFIDMDTPLDKRTTKSFVDGSTYQLVMSDEFNVENRSFADGHDPLWTALDKPDDDSNAAGGGSQQFYNSSFVTTKDGMMHISTKIGKTEWSRFDTVNKVRKTESAEFKSGMVQTWEKFCFTGGIIEVDVILPGDAFVGGLWPAIWMLGNLGRSTYEGSTNNIWPWSYDVCDRKKQDAQKISACNEQNHYGMHPFQGRGATEIDILEVMTGDSDGFLPSTEPPISLPYADMTLQVAPGIPKNRPSSGYLPVRQDTLTKSGLTQFLAQTWYEGLEMEGNTSINPFFYGTYLGETKPGEPVTRTKKQAFQADAVGVAHQMTPDNFRRPHTFRLEWQPGTGGRLDWFVKSHKVNDTLWVEGDGKGDDWTRVFTLKDESLKNLTGAHIPIEPTSLIMNVAVSSTWGFPYNVPESCKKCYDCNDPKCACTFSPGFCEMVRHSDVKMSIDSVRVYQSNDDSAHVGAPHSLGCDPPEFPTKEWIKGYEYLYMRNAPFSFTDKGPLRNVQKGGGQCKIDSDCGSEIKSINLTQVFENGEESSYKGDSQGRGRCVASQEFHGMLSKIGRGGPDKICQCYPGFTGPHCLAQHHIDYSPSAYKLKKMDYIFDDIPSLEIPSSMAIFAGAIFFGLTGILIVAVWDRKNERSKKDDQGGDLRRPVFRASGENQDLIITGTSI